MAACSACGYGGPDDVHLCVALPRQTVPLIDIVAQDVEMRSRGVQVDHIAVARDVSDACARADGKPSATLTSLLGFPVVIDSRMPPGKWALVPRRAPVDEWSRSLMLPRAALDPGDIRPVTATEAVESTERFAERWQGEIISPILGRAMDYIGPWQRLPPRRAGKSWAMRFVIDEAERLFPSTCPRCLRETRHDVNTFAVVCDGCGWRTGEPVGPTHFWQDRRCSVCGDASSTCPALPAMQAAAAAKLRDEERGARAALERARAAAKARGDAIEAALDAGDVYTAGNLVEARGPGLVARADLSPRSLRRYELPAAQRWSWR